MENNEIYKRTRERTLQRSDKGCFAYRQSGHSLFLCDGDEPERASGDINPIMAMDRRLCTTKPKKKRPLEKGAMGSVSMEVRKSLHDSSTSTGKGTERVRKLDEFRDLLSGGIVVNEVAWEDCDTTDQQLQSSIYSFLDKGLIRITNIPKIPIEYEPQGAKVFYGFDSEDDSCGKPHFFQFALRDYCYISHSWRLLFRYLVQTYKLNGRNNIVWGTNIEYDLGNLLKDWDITKDTCNLKWTKGGLKKFDLEYKKEFLPWANEEDEDGTIKVWDTLSHWKMGVKDIGKALTEHLGFDFNKIEQDFYGLKYSCMDAILSRSYGAVQKKYYDDKGIELKFTPAATALNFYMRGHDVDGDLFCKHKLFNTHEQEELEWLIGGLRGGRTEVFSLREYRGKIGYYDLNSAYPYSMRHGVFPHPSKHRRVLGHKKIDAMIQAGYEGLIECNVDTDNACEFVRHIPYLGTIQPKTGRYIFPLGNWTAKYTVFEIKKAIELGYGFEFKEAIMYEPSMYQPFSGYVDFCYAIRDEGTKKEDKILRDIGKSLGNNLYGKFGQRLRFTELVDPKEYNQDDIADCIKIGKGVLLEKDEGFAPHSNIIWSIYITAICRDLLYGHMLKAWACGNEVLYCDTDSIFITGGKAPDSHQTRLGALKHEGDLSYFKAILPKTYVYEIGEKTCYKAKGVPEKEQKRFLTHGQVEYKKPMKIREAMRRKKFGAKDVDKHFETGVGGINAWVTMTKELSGKYTKRSILKDNRTVPIILGKE